MQKLWIRDKSTREQRASSTRKSSVIRWVWRGVWAGDANEPPVQNATDQNQWGTAGRTRKYETKLKRRRWSWAELLQTTRRNSWEKTTSLDLFKFLYVQFYVVTSTERRLLVPPHPHQLHQLHQPVLIRVSPAAHPHFSLYFTSPCCLFWILAAFQTDPGLVSSPNPAKKRRDHITVFTVWSSVF